jgi:hypothetical protein
MKNSFLLLALPVAALIAGPLMAGTRPVAPNGAHPEFYRPPILGSPTQIVPQYNTPGPQLAVPQPGDAAQQLSPLTPLNPPPGSSVVQLPPLGLTVNPLPQTSPLGSKVP